MSNDVNYQPNAEHWLDMNIDESGRVSETGDLLQLILLVSVPEMQFWDNLLLRLD